MHRTIGDIELTALSDGPFPATLDTLLDFDRDEAQRLIGKPAGVPFFLPVNSYLLAIGNRRVLIDTGCGPTMGPQLGRLPTRLRELGVAPETIDVWGDVVHIPAIQVARPDAAFEYDVDPQAARATRARTFDMVCADRLCVAGAHLDFPGLGTIVRSGASYRFEAAA